MKTNIFFTIISVTLILTASVLLIRKPAVGAMIFRGYLDIWDCDTEHNPVTYASNGYGDYVIPIDYEYLRAEHPGYLYLVKTYKIIMVSSRPNGRRFYFRIYSLSVRYIHLTNGLLLPDHSSHVLCSGF